MESLPNSIPSASFETSSAKVVVCKELFTLLCSVIEMPFVTTFNQVLKGLSTYVYKKKLFDVKKPMNIYCKGDDLANVLGVDEFTIPEVGKYLNGLVFPILERRSALDAECFSNDDPKACKRKLEESDDKERGVKLKVNSSENSKIQTGSIVSDTSKTPLVYENHSASVLSIRRCEAAFVKDTSDEENLNFFDGTNGDEYRLGEIFDIEYEVESSSSTDDFSSFSDDSDDFLHTSVLRFVCKTDSDMEFFADISFSDENTTLSPDDEEINEADKWLCNSCGYRNQPAMRHCEKCWNNRSSWLSSEPIKRTKPKKFRKRKKAHLETSQTKELLKTEDLSFPCTSQYQKLNLEHLSHIEEKKSCLLCCENTVNSSIIHGKTAHRISCYGCARRLFSKAKSCPICRRKIDKVVKELS